jgi:penicillin-binding protein 1B
LLNLNSENSGTRIAINLCVKQWGKGQEEMMRNSESHSESGYQKILNFGRHTVMTLRSHRDSKVFEFFYAHKSLLQSFAIALGLLTIFSSALFFIEYKYYAAVVDERLAGETLNYPPGIYASPVHINVGKPISKDDLRERLLKADYIEGTEPNEFANGNFIIQENAIEIHSSASTQNTNIPAVVRVNFAGQTGKAKTGTGILKITNEQTRENINDFLLPAEMLTAGTENRSQTRRATSFDELPKNLIDALCAIEDRNFFEHNGVDFVAMLRAAFRNIKEGEVRQGASTITQQLVKNMFLSPDRTYQRKFAEAFMAMAIERRLSKAQILALYCENIYLGQSRFTAIYGFKQAAQVYFGKPLSELTLAETATLAGMAKAPNRFSPYTKAEDAIARRNLVLDCMLEQGHISADVAAMAKAEKLSVRPTQTPDNSSAPHFVDYLKKELVQRNIPEENIGRYRIETSIDPELQKTATQVVNTHLERITKLVAKRNKSQKPEAALIAIDPHTGRILAMVGGRDYSSSQLNRVTDAMRQPGSVFKPFVYAAALANGISPASMFDNSPQEFHYGYKAVYKPGNFRGSYTNQPVMLREGIVRSSNVVTVAAALRVGLGRVAEMAKRAGLPIPNIYPSMALGAFEATPMDVAHAYTAFANDGTSITPFGIDSVRSSSTVIAGGNPVKTSVLAASAAYVVTDTLADVVNRGTAARVRQLGYHGPAAGKTGTSRDAWFVGYTPNLLVVVWVGNDDNKDLGLTGGEAAVPIWTDFVKQALSLRSDLSAESFSKPAGIQTVEIDTETGMVANEYCPNKTRVAMPSYLSVGMCYLHSEQLPIAEETVFIDGEGDIPANEMDRETMEKELDKALRELEHSDTEADEEKPQERAMIVKDTRTNKMRRYD